MLLKLALLEKTGKKSNSNVQIHKTKDMKVYEFTTEVSKYFICIFSNYVIMNTLILWDIFV